MFLHRHLYETQQGVWRFARVSSLKTQCCKEVRPVTEGGYSSIVPTVKRYLLPRHHKRWAGQKPPTHPCTGNLCFSPRCGRVRGWVQPYRAHHLISIHHNSFYGARVRGRRQTAQIQDPFKTIPQSTGISLHAFSCVFFVHNALSLRPTEGGSIKEASTMSLKLHNLRLLASIQKWGFRPSPGKPKQQEDRFELCNLLFFYHM